MHYFGDSYIIVVWNVKFTVIVVCESRGIVLLRCVMYVFILTISIS